MSERTTLRMTWDQPAVVLLAVDWQTVEVGWDDVLFAVAAEALRGKPALALTADPPYWNVDPRAVSAQAESRLLDGYQELLLPIAPGDCEGLRAAVESSDFRLGTLLLTAIPADDLRRVETLLAAVHAAASVEPIITGELLLQCNDDTRLYLHNSSEECLGRIRDVLAVLTERLGWALADQTRGRVR